jgi:hypothetical protein
MLNGQTFSSRTGKTSGLPKFELRDRLSRINYRLGRNKALRNGWPLRVGAADGHEFFSQPPSMLRPVF